MKVWKQLKLNLDPFETIQKHIKQIFIFKFQQNAVRCWSRFQEVHAAKEGGIEVRKRQNGARLSKKSFSPFLKFWKNICCH